MSAEDEADEAKICVRLRTDFGLDQAAAESALQVNIPTGYYSISLKAAKELLPLIERGKTYAEARRERYPDQFATLEPASQLPPLLPDRNKPLAQHLQMPAIRNPIVLRALSELRKVVNAIIRRYGKPDVIRVELARELKRNLDDRLTFAKNNRQQEERRLEAKRELVSHGCAPTEDAVRSREIEIYLLWKECGHQCPYTGKPIGLDSLFGAYPQFQVEHIIPLSRSLDDSFANKTLCYHELNATKARQTPWKAFGKDPGWEDMVARVKEFRNPAKLRRFQMKETETNELLEKFSTQMLNDTRYASRLAARYLGMLYGGEKSGGIQRVFTTSGPVTSWLRSEWELSRILNPDSPVKTRDDHRHHAIDAAVIAVSTPSIVQQLSAAADNARASRRRRFGRFPEPWPGFVEQLREAIAATNVSLRSDYKLNSRMHDETLYARRVGDGSEWVRIRKSVEDVDPDKIVDSHIRGLVLARIKELGSQKELKNHPPTLTTPFGEVAIRKVRVREKASVEKVGSGVNPRWVKPNSVHHIEVVRNESAKKTKFDGYPVSTLEAAARRRARQEVVQREFGERETLVCTIRSGDILQSWGRLYRIRSARTSGQLEMHGLSDAREKNLIARDKAMLNPTINPLFQSGARKVRISLLGEIEAAND